MVDNRKWLPLLKQDEVRGFRRVIYEGRKKFDFGTDLDNADVRVPPGLLVTGEDFVAFEEMVVEAQGLPVKLMIPIEELKARFETAERMKDLQKTLLDAGAACGKAAMQRQNEVGVVVNDFKGQIKALVDAQGEGPEADTRAQEATDVMRRSEDRKKQRTIDHQRAVDQVKLEGRRQDEDKDAYIVRLEDTVSRLQQSVSDLLHRLDLSHLPPPQAGPAAHGTATPPAPAPGRRSPR